jgi:hypothetical protein
MFAPVETEEPDRGENMAGHNPYAPTQASLKSADTPAGTGGLWREGNCLVVARGAAFPHRCVKCNEPSEEPHKLRKVYWHHPAVYLLLLAYAILYIIVALIVRRTMEINPGLCTQHREKRTLWIRVGWLGSFAAFAGVLILGGALGVQSPWIPLVAVLAFFTLAILGIVKSRLVYPQRIDDNQARLKGCGESFLASLPGSEFR